MDVNFSGVNLEGSVFNGIYLVNTSFRSANLERSHLRAFIY
nr:pentapeptide repeat-containing protein [Scytonema hofmannii]